MKRSIGFSAVLAVLLSVPGLVSTAQEVPLPLTWAGEGMTWYVGEDDVYELEFDFSLHVDEDGAVSGTAGEPEGPAVIKKMYYGYPKDGARTMIIVLEHTTDDGTFIYLMNGTVLHSSLYFGESYMMVKDAESEVVKALNLGNSIASEVYSSYMPASLKNALEEATLVGSFVVTGEFVR